MNQCGNGSADDGGGWWDGSIGGGQMLRDLVAQHAGARAYASVRLREGSNHRPVPATINLRTVAEPTVHGWTVRLTMLDGAYHSILEGDTISLVGFEIYATLREARADAQQAFDAIPWIWGRSVQPTPCAAAL